MIGIHTQRVVRVVTVEKPTAWFVVAVVVETRNNESYIVSEPRILKIIPKQVQPTLEGKVASSPLLGGKTSHFAKITAPIVSPYSDYLFSYTDSLIASQKGARPPTS